MAGGVLRKNIGTIRDEIDDESGVFTATNGIISTINKLRIYDYNYKDKRYNGGWQTTAPISAPWSKAFPDWGNPLAEMIYETTRYFAGGTGPTEQFTAKSKIDDELGLPRPAWENPLSAANYCAQPVMVAISDIYPSYDSDHLPGSAWGKPISSSLPGLNVEERFKKIAVADRKSVV